MRILSILFVVLTLASCSREIPVDDLTFSVRPVTDYVNTLDSVRFIFTGKPDYITFYSGEPGKRYEYRNRISDTSTNVQLRFSSATTTATNGTLQLLVSSDFSGELSAENVAKSNWINITSRATLATGTTVVSSGDISLADFASQRKPVYIAFRYMAQAGSVQRRWTITGLTLSHILPEKTYIIGNMTATPPSPGWIALDAKNPLVNWSGSLVITGATTAATAVETDDWMVMGPVDLSRVLPDEGSPIKSLTEGMDKFPFVYRYTSAGNYKAVFVAGNVNRYAENALVRTVPIIVQ